MSKDDDKKAGITRRELLGGSAKLVALAGAGGVAGLASGPAMLKIVRMPNARRTGPMAAIAG